jgi:hypothetical protein
LDYLDSIMDANLFDGPPPPDEYNVPPPAYNSFEDAYGQWCAAVGVRRTLPTQTLVIEGLEQELRDAKEILECMKMQRCVCVRLFRGVSLNVGVARGRSRLLTA